MNTERRRDNQRAWRFFASSRLCGKKSWAQSTTKTRSYSLSAAKRGRKSCQGFSFVCSWEHTHPACRMLDTLGTLEACAPRDGTSAFSAVVRKNWKNANFAPVSY